MTAAALIASLVLLTMGLASIAVGLRGIVRKRAFIISARWVFLVVLVEFLPSLILVSILSRTVGSFIPILMLKLFVVLPLVIILWIQTRGYLLFAITSQMVGSALRIALQALDIRFVETVSSVEVLALAHNLWMDQA